jgi:hypothetical protein
MPKWGDRCDKCKCGKLIVWNTETYDDLAGVECKSCGTEYRVEADSRLVYWLEEKLEIGKPYTTSAR